ncbi:ABC transporter ATP-binding protein [Microbacterium sp. CPCC 204701]|uniref:ABC transporter ATP-binding protein n=1 Tax=Microbacterium sp. CPCC 204701 TaxID=2493084 RepID=UPI000FDA100B|nr:ABC transporter ATP-binding protein [Microbacterium sp. CPCC 204701]
MISADDVTHAYDGVDVLREVTLAADEGEVVGLIGPNGSGKTTLLRALYRALVPDHGEIRVGDAPIAQYSSRMLAQVVAVVTQESHSDVPLSVADTVLLGRSPHLGAVRRQSAADLDIAADSLDRVGAGHLAARDIAELSGGERQRVLIARALAQQASHLLMDEPTNHLDIHFQHEILALVRELGVTTVVVLHDLNLAARYCDRLVLLSRGRVAAAGRTEDVLRPAVVEPVYGIHVDPVRAGDGRLQLLFRSPDHRMPQTHDHTGGHGTRPTGQDVRTSPRM